MTALARPTVVYAGLVLATALALLFVTPAAHELLTARGAAAAAAVVAFLKVRFVVSDFMELRGTRLQRVYDGWLVLVAAGSVALILR